ncbi:hypothetical protein GN244_ATG08821 [Phytophthora infestans]|uniref:Uncharacterized protein n=1 Tax=Phytophthora infestans TaxID=4787 RepID=A0A833T9J4_PHYIN|nr:hypothetical protein GN244_ATG08821 [Phytophthora infestans]
MTKTTTDTGSSREAVRHHASACASRPEQQSTLTQTPLLAEREHDSEEVRTQTQCQVLVTRLTQQQPVERRTHQKMRVVSVPNNQRQAEEYEDKPMYLPMEAYDQDQTRRPAEMMEEPDTQQQQQQTHQHEDEQSDHLTKKTKSRPFTCLLDEGDAVSTAWCPHDLASADGGRTTLWLNAAEDDIGPAPADTYWSSKLNGWVIDLTQTAPQKLWINQADYEALWRQGRVHTGADEDSDDSDQDQEGDDSEDDSDGAGNAIPREPAH